LLSAALRRQEGARPAHRFWAAGRRRSAKAAMVRALSALL
jgi:hypothetical protein